MTPAVTTVEQQVSVGPRPNPFALGMNSIISVVDTPGGHILICSALMVAGHYLGEKEWAAAGLGGLLVAMRGQAKLA